MTPSPDCDWLGILLALMAAIVPLIGAWWLLGISGGARKSLRSLKTRK